MRKIILIAVIAILGITFAQAQVDSTYSPDYGIELKNDTVFRSNGKTIVHYVKTFPPRFMNKAIVFYFDTETWNITDSVLVKKKPQNEVKLKKRELEYVLFNKPVYQWLEETTKPNPQFPDSVVFTYVGQIVYDYKVLGGN